ncbi:MAG: succinate dehydrogenase, cytochrome b556 subunit [Burkholderiales bacterium]|nr:succinate dehydrogenase, cytochrome b556 subunit [Burkholderiales bacterium]
MAEAVENSTNNAGGASGAGSSGGRAARPEFRNINVGDILSYRMPSPAIVSILHRISGVLLFLVGLPFILYLFQQSLLSEISYENYRAIVSHWFAKLVLLALIWAYLHHLIAGLRFLFLDVHVGVDKPSARKSAAAVLIISLPLTLIIALKLFGVF